LVVQYEDRWKIWSKAKYDMMTDREKVKWLKCEKFMDEKWKCEFYNKEIMILPVLKHGPRRL